MEALSAVTASLLSVYDLTKGIDPNLSLRNYLNYKEGGKSGQWHHPHFNTSEAIVKNSLFDKISAAITISGRAYNKQKNYIDESGPYIVDFLKSNGAEVKYTTLVPDEIDLIQKEIIRFSKENKVDLILTTGGTGLCPRDVTPEALKAILEKEIPGFGELLRSEGSLKTQNAYLSRSISGIIEKTLIVALPGSLKAVREGVNALFKILPHSIGSLKEDTIHKNHIKEKIND
ncbi:MAG: molybdenum cofactor synthesis domain-containing protein [Bacteriovoracaceae bacterium]